MTTTMEKKVPVDCLDVNIDELEILKTIGKGKTCTVRTAKMPNSEKVYALKQFKSYASSLSDLMNETKALGALEHPNIIKLIASDKKNLVLEYLSNGELFDTIAIKRMTERVAKFYFRELMSALKHVHENNWVHRDIKLENILLSDDLHLQLADFGFATKTQEGKLFERVMGTEGYMAPELQARQKYCGKKVDIFAAGVVLFSMVNGMPPFFKAAPSDPYYKYFFDNNLEQYWANLSKRYNNVISVEFKDLISSMLCADTENRIDVEAILAHPWL